jgi:F-type H+-transporting ATPase subunit a
MLAAHAHPHHESWFTGLLNQTLAGPANALLNAIGKPAHDPSHPWADWMATQIFVALVIMALAAVVRAGLSMDKPGGLQHTFEGLYGFVKQQAIDVIGHHDGKKHVVYTGTVFLFIVTMNLIGIVPAFESPTMFPMVPLGCAIATFLYYNIWGFSTNGLGYLKHFAGPIWWLSWFMFPLEIISHLIRPMSLTIRLYANMLAGEQVTLGFLALVPLLVPVVFMGLHTFVSLLQAFIFMVLTMAYVGEAVAHEEAH